MPERNQNKPNIDSKINSGMRALKSLLPEFLIVLGLFSIIFYAVHNHNIRQSLRVNQEIVGQYQAKAQAEEKNSPTHITIPWFVDVSIREDFYDNGSWTVSEDTASYLAQSAQPGEAGNIIIYGHNKREILGNIRALEGGEEITLKTKDDNEHRYKVTKTREVDPGDVSFLQPTETETLTIYTCSGFMDSKRFIVQAVPIE